MEIKREVTINGGGLAVAKSIVCGGEFTTPLASPVKVLRVGIPTRRWAIPAAPTVTGLVSPDVLETAGYLALWACGLLGIGLCLI